MKIRIRVISLILALFLLVGVLPLAIFGAVSPKTGYDLPDGDGDYDRIFSHDGVTEKFSSFKYPSSSDKVNFTVGDTAFISTVTDGDEAVLRILKRQMINGAYNNTFYDARLLSKYVNVATNTDPAKYEYSYEAYREYAGRSFSVSFDIKLGEDLATSYANSNLFGVMCSWVVSPSAKWINPLRLNCETGEISLLNADDGTYTKTSVVLSGDRYTKIAVFFEPTENRMDLYAEGKLISSVKMMSSDVLGALIGDCPTYESKAAVDVSGLAPEEAERKRGESFFPTFVRFFQEAKCDLLVDNLSWDFYAKNTVYSSKMRADGDKYYFDLYLDVSDGVSKDSSAKATVITPSGAVTSYILSECENVYGKLKISVPIAEADRVGDVRITLSGDSGIYPVYVFGRANPWITLSVDKAIETMKNVDASIEMVYGGARGIVTMTFDDGYYSSAVILDELFEKYGLQGSLMLIASKLSGAESWKRLFSHGNLEPQSHSMTHMPFRDQESDAANHTPENYEREIVGSKTKLESLFPEFDCITFAIPHGGWTDAAAKIGAENYYLVRTTQRGNQTLDPGFTPGETGSWSKFRSPPVVVGAGNDQLEYLKSMVDAAKEGYWYCPIAHRVGDVEGTEIPLDVLEGWCKYLSEAQEDGELWVTTLSSATKYVRERQNSTVSARYDNGAITVKVEMAAETADGLPLTPEVFDHPLTVKVMLPQEYQRVFYTVNGEMRVTEAIRDGFDNYALVDVIPGAAEVKLVPTLDAADESDAVLVRGHSLTVDSGFLGLNFYLDLGGDVLADTSTVVKLTTPEGKTTETYLKDITPEPDGSYKVTAKVTSVEMAKNITLDVVGVKEYGIYSFGVRRGVHLYSVRDYAVGLLDDPQYGELVRAMLNYGAESQKYFGYDLSALANADCEYGATATATDVSGVSITGTLGADTEATLVLESDITVRIYSSDGAKIGELCGVQMLDLDTPYTVECRDGSVTLSVLAVGEKALTGDSSEEMKTLTRALKRFYDEVKEVFG